MLLLVIWPAWLDEDYHEYNMVLGLTGIHVAALKLVGYYNVGQQGNLVESGHVMYMYNIYI